MNNSSTVGNPTAEKEAHYALQKPTGECIGRETRITKVTGRAQNFPR